MEYDEFNDERGMDEEGLSESQLANVMYTDTRPVDFKNYDYCSEGDNGDRENLGLMIT
jgi:hypothetical protein